MDKEMLLFLWLVPTLLLGLLVELYLLALLARAIQFRLWCWLHPLPLRNEPPRMRQRLR